MKSIYNFMPLFLFILLSCGINTIAYNYKFVNETGKDVKVQLESTTGWKLNKRPVLIEADDQYTFSFKGLQAGVYAILCLKKIMLSVKKRKGWGSQKEVKIKFIGKDGREVTRGKVFLAKGGPRMLSMCRGKKFFLRINQKSKKINAIVKVNIRS